MIRLSAYIQPCEEKIIRPLEAKVGCNFDKCITVNSPVWQKELIAEIRRYQSLECADKSYIDASDDCWEGLRAHPILGSYYDEDKEEFRELLVGAVVFRISFGRAFLESCWVHPCYRNKGILKEMWPEFKKLYGEFRVPPYPTTKAMQGFLNSVGHLVELEF